MSLRENTGTKVCERHMHRPCGLGSSKQQLRVGPYDGPNGGGGLMSEVPLCRQPRFCAQLGLRLCVQYKISQGVDVSYERGTPVHAFDRAPPAKAMLGALGSRNWQHL